MRTSATRAAQWVSVHTIAPFSSSGVVATFAIDTPSKGDRTAGEGLEINGWAIGHGSPLLGIRAEVNEEQLDLVSLSVHRPDVAADYSEIPHAAESGFSFWVPLVPDERWELRIDAVAADGAAVPLVGIQGNVSGVVHSPAAGHQTIDAPDFVIIGTQRGGTTSLHAYLNALNRIVMPATKELHYLTDRHVRGRDWYLGQFPAEVPIGVLTGEATPYALFHPNAAARLRAIAPAAKLIVLLRNPVERAYSHYLLERAGGYETLSFENALAAELERLSGEAERLEGDPAYISTAHNHASYLARGDYAPQLACWFGEFPKDQFLILRSEDFYEETAQSFAQVTRFLRLPPAHDISFVAHNRGAGPALGLETRDRLSHYFAPLNAKLAELLGWDPRWR